MSKQTEVAYRIVRNYPLAIPLILVAILALPICLQIRRLGIYPDAVNPDYLAIRMLHWRSNSVAWVLPGNYLANRFPVLAGGLYHGSLQAYLQLPFTLFGTSVTGFQISHLFLAVLVAMAVFEFLWRISGSLWLPTAICALLILDPAFIFTFFTQAYITTFPDAFVICACTIILGDKGVSGAWRRYLGAGSLLGLAIWGYFIHLFFLPGFFALLFIEHYRLPAPRPRLSAKCLALAAGVACGAILYFVGYGLLFNSLGLQAGLGWLSDTVTSLLQMRLSAPADLSGYSAERVLSVLTADWHANTIFYAGRMSYFEIAKVVVLLVAPLAAFPFAGGDSLLARGFRCIGIVFASFLAIALLLGHKLGGHHDCALVPMTYTLFGASVALLGQNMARIGQRLRTFSLGAVLAAIAAINVFFLEEFSWRIHNGESARLYASEINDYPMAARKTKGDYAYVFMNWGVILTFTYLTKGKIEAYEGDQLPVLLCQSKPLKLVFTQVGAADAATATLERLKLAGPVETWQLGRGWEYSVVTLDPPTTPRCTS